MKNYSKQREELLLVLKKLRIHPTAEEIYQKLKDSNSTSSRGTVYRNLKDLVDENIIWKIPISDGADRYDYPYENHNHIVCKRCGEVQDFNYDFNSKKVLDEIKNQTGMNTRLETIITYGFCEDCMNKL